MSQFSSWECNASLNCLKSVFNHCTVRLVMLTGLPSQVHVCYDTFVVYITVDQRECMLSLTHQKRQRGLDIINLDSRVSREQPQSSTRVKGWSFSAIISLIKCLMA